MLTRSRAERHARCQRIDLKARTHPGLGLTANQGGPISRFVCDKQTSRASRRLCDASVMGLLLAIKAVVIVSKSPTDHEMAGRSARLTSTSRSVAQQIRRV